MAFATRFTNIIKNPLDVLNINSGEQRQLILLFSYITLFALICSSFLADAKNPLIVIERLNLLSFFVAPSYRIFCLFFVCNPTFLLKVNLTLALQLRSYDRAPKSGPKPFQQKLLQYHQLITPYLALPPEACAQMDNLQR